jgi:nuclear pore complex protein Nup85
VRIPYLPHGIASHVTFRDVVNQILESMPPDPTDPEDMIHVALFRGETMEALSHAAKLDVWLAAHWVDLMDAVDLLNPRVGDE